MRGHGRFMRPIPQEDQRPISRSTVRRVASTFRPYRGQVAWVGAAIAVTSGLGVVNPIMIKLIFDRALFGNPPGSCAGQPCPQLPTLYVFVAIMVAIPVVSGIIGIGQTYLANLVGLRVMQDLRNALYSHLQFMPLRFFTTTRTGEIQSRLANDVGGVQTVVTDTASSILSNVVVIVSTLIAMFAISWQLTALSLSLLPFFLWLTYKVGKARREVATSTQKTLADLTAITEETLSVSGILLSKAFGRQQHEIGRFRSENERLTGLQIKQTMIGRSFFAVVGTFFSITPALVYLVAGWVLARGSGGLTAGDIVAFTTLQSRLFFPIGSMLQVSTEVQSSFALFDRIFEYLDMQHEIADAPDAVPLPAEAVRGRVTFDHVWFRYDRPAIEDAPEGQDPQPSDDGEPSVATRAWALEDVTLEIQPGQLAALVGPSGAGKTTMTYLVPRFYDVQRGSVRRARLQALGRREAAPGHRPRGPQGPQDPDPRRGHLQPGHHLGAAGPGSPAPADARAHDHRHRPPAVDDPVGRRDLRGGPGTDRRAREPRRAGDQRRHLRPAVPAAVPQREHGGRHPGRRGARLGRGGPDGERPGRRRLTVRPRSLGPSLAPGPRPHHPEVQIRRS